MEIIDPIIKFTGTLLDRNRAEIDGLELKAEYFNLVTNNWETIIPVLPVDGGSFNGNIDLADDVFKTDEIFQPIYNALETGNLPMTRVSLADGDPDMPQVVGLGGIVKFELIEDKNEITIDFSTLYYLDPYLIQRGNMDADLGGGGYNLVGFPEPQPIEENELFPAIQAALSQTENFSEFTIEGHTVVVRPNGDEFEDEGAIKDLTDQLSEREEELENEKAKVEDLENALTVEKENVTKLTNDLKIEQGKLVEVTKLYEREKAKLDRMTMLYDMEVEKVFGLEKALNLEKSKVLEYTKALEFEKTNSLKITKLYEAEKGRTVELEKTIGTLKENVHTLESDITECKLVVDNLESDITECKVEVDRLEEEKLDILGRDATPANEVYKSIVRELETASEESTSSRFSVSNLSLNLKTHIVNDGDGFKLQLIDSARADYVKDGTISDIQLDIISQDPPDTSPAVIIMPKINGLTETATRKRLTAFGLVLKPIYQASTTQTIGQAFKQTPEAGTEVTVGDTITVIFAKDTENFN